MSCMNWDRGTERRVWIPPSWHCSFCLCSYGTCLLSSLFHLGSHHRFRFGSAFWGITASGRGTRSLSLCACRLSKERDHSAAEAQRSDCICLLWMLLDEHCISFVRFLIPWYGSCSSFLMELFSNFTIPYCNYESSDQPEPGSPGEAWHRCRHPSFLKTAFNRHCLIEPRQLWLPSRIPRVVYGPPFRYCYAFAS